MPLVIKNIAKQLVLIAAVAIAPGLECLAQDPMSERQQAQELFDEDVAEAVGLEGKSARLESIEIFTNRRLNDWHIYDVSKLAEQSSSLAFNEGVAFPDTRLYIRGLGPTFGHPTVALVLDGINYSSEALFYTGGSSLATLRLVDVEQAQIFKGPQTVRFGPGAFAGAIEFTTATPSNDFEAKLKLDIGNNGRRNIMGKVSGPIVDEKFNLGLSSAYWHHDGFYENEITGADIGGEEGFGLTATSLLTPNDLISIKSRLAYIEDDSDPSAHVFVPFNTTLPVPDNAINAGLVGVNPNLDAMTGSGLSPLTGLPWFTDTAVAAFVGTVPNADDLPVRLSPNYLATNGASPAPDFPGTERDILRLSNVIELRSDMGVLTSRTGFLSANVSAFFDNDRFAIPGAVPGSDISFASDIHDSEVETEQVSQELILATDFDGPVQFSLGGLWRQEDVEMVDSNHSIISGGNKCRSFPSFVDSVPGCPGFTSVSVARFVPDVHAARIPTSTERSVSHWSVFGSAQWNINSEWRVTLAGRYVDEELKVTGPATIFPLTAGTGIVAICGWNGDCNALPASGSFDINGFGSFATMPLSFERDDKYFAPTAMIEWRPNETDLLYALVSQTQNPGGFNTTLIDTFGIDRDHDGLPLESEFTQERITVYELGAHKSWRGNTLHTRGSLFNQDIEDKLVDGNRTSSGIGEFRDLIIPKSAEIWGVELVADWQVSDRLFLDVSYTFLQSEIDDYVTLSASDRQIAAGGNCMITTTDSGLTVCAIDQSGRELNNVSNHAFIGGFHYAASFANDLGWFVDGRARFTSSRYIDDSNISKLDAYWTADLQAGLVRQNWRASIYINNIFDDDTVRSAATSIATACCKDWRAGGIVGETVFAPRLPQATYAVLPDRRSFGVRLAMEF